MSLLFFGLLTVFFILLGYVFAQSEFLWLEVVLSILTIAVLAGIFVSLGADYLQKAKTSELLNLTAGAKTPLIEYYSFHGHWPGPEIAQEIKTQGKYTENIRIEDGAISGDLKDRGFTLTLRPVLAETQPKVISWVCGYAQPPPGLAAHGANRTTLPPAYLPHSCRN